MARNPSPYERFLEREAIPTISDPEQMYDMGTAGPLAFWQRKGILGAYVDHKFGIVNPSRSQVLDAYLAEIPGAGEERPQRYLYEEVIYILAGKGATTFWLEEGEKQTVEWQQGSLFAIPLNTWHQHFNASRAPVRYFGVTLLPGMINAFHNEDFIFNNSYAFRDRYAGEVDFFDADKGDVYAAISTGAKVWESNFIPDVRAMPLWDWKERGAGGGNRMFQLGQNVLVAHASEIPAGSYKKAHYHKDQGGLGGYIIAPNGEGYTLNWEETMIKWSEARQREKSSWKANTLFTYNTDWWHQHFNTGSEAARYVAIYLGSHKYTGFGYFEDRERVSVDTRRGGRQIAYEDEDPEVLRLFQEELAARGGNVKDPSLWHHALEEEPEFDAQTRQVTYRATG